jgi:hypothetical protein
MKIGDIHGIDGLAIESLNGFYLLANASALNNDVLYLDISKQSLFSKFLGSLFKDSHARVLLPKLEIFVARVLVKVVNTIQVIEDSLLLKKLFKFHKLHLSVIIFGQTSTRYHHVVLWILFLELYDLPVVGIIAPVHVTELVRHLAVDSKFKQYYFKISMKS